MAKKKVTPPAEFDEAYNRVTTEINLNDWEGVYNTDDFIRKVHDKYQLNVESTHEIYRHMAERANETDFWADNRMQEHNKPLIQEQLTKYMQENVDEGDYSTSTEEKNIKEYSKKVFTRDQQDKFDDKVASELRGKVSSVLQEEVRGEKKATDKVAEDELTISKIKETEVYKSAEERIKLNKKLVKNVYDTDVWRVKQYAQRDLLPEVLKQFQKPQFISKAAKELYDTGRFTQARKPMELRQPQTIERDISAMRLVGKGYARRVRGGFILTAKGKKILGQLEE